MTSYQAFLARKQHAAHNDGPIVDAASIHPTLHAGRDQADERHIAPLQLGFCNLERG